MSDFKKQIEKVIADIESEISGFVSFEDLFDLGFMDKNSDFGTLGEFFEFYNLKVNSMEDFEALDEDLLNDAVEKSTCFSSWDEMYQQAGTEYALKKLKNAGFDITD